MKSSLRKFDLETFLASARGRASGIRLRGYKITVCRWNLQTLGPNVGVNCICGPIGIELGLRGIWVVGWSYGQEVCSDVCFMWLPCSNQMIRRRRRSCKN